MSEETPLHALWNHERKKRRKKLENMTCTNTYIPKNQIRGITVYRTDENSGHPFQVTVTCEKIVVNTFPNLMYPHLEEEKDSDYTNTIIEIVDFEGYWTGFDSSYYKMHGNSLLVKLNISEYIYIGPIIILYKLDDEIIDFVAYMGNNDVPYSVAIGTENFYILEEREEIQLSEFENIIKISDIEDIIINYYKGKYAISDTPPEHQVLIERIAFKPVKNRKLPLRF